MNDSKMENEIIKIIQPEGTIDLIFIFGSVLTDRFRDESDIDIAVLPKVGKSEEELLNLKMELINYFARDIDLINLRTAGVVLAKEVVYKGKIIYKSSQKIKEEYEYTIGALYGQFVDDVEIVIQKIKERGRIYA